MSLAEVPRPQAFHGMVLVKTRASLISAGTERMIVELARKSLLRKVRARPDLVQKVVRSIRKEGLGPALQKGPKQDRHPRPLRLLLLGCGLRGRERC